MRTVWHRLIDKHADQWDQPESLEVNPYIYGQLIFGKSATTSQWGKNVSSVRGHKWIPIYNRVKLDPSLTPCIKIKMS